MRSKNYNTNSTKIKYDEKEILKIIEKAKKLEISPREAEKEIEKYLFSDKNISVKEHLRRVSLYEKFTEGFYSPGNGMLTPLIELYALKHNLTGKLTT